MPILGTKSTSGVLFSVENGFYLPIHESTLHGPIPRFGKVLVCSDTLSSLTPLGSIAGEYQNIPTLDRVKHHLSELGVGLVINQLLIQGDENKIIGHPGICIQGMDSSIISQASKQLGVPIVSNIQGTLEEDLTGDCEFQVVRMNGDLFLKITPMNDKPPQTLLVFAPTMTILEERKRCLRRSMKLVKAFLKNPRCNISSGEWHADVIQFLLKRLATTTDPKELLAIQGFITSFSLPISNQESRQLKVPNVLISQIVSNAVAVACEVLQVRHSVVVTPRPRAIEAGYIE
eukprot:TRINITY_DN9393_c0_g1_i1.p1 TRINITY_DN9393_c0_g1~~TRINITY_DN9393_c0_g1_i1.p1  ORF type:complete len:289 (+),score=48.61 TRINITY_DN9393_c0_g1_i1:167-1033(+)